MENIQQFTFTNTGINYILKYIKIGILNCLNVSHYYYLYGTVYHIKAALVSIRDFFQKHLKRILLFLPGNVSACIYLHVQKYIHTVTYIMYTLHGIPITPSTVGCLLPRYFFIRDVEFLYI